VERPDAVAVWAARRPGSRLTPLRFGPPLDSPAAGGGWPELPAGTALLLFADPFSFPADAFLAWAAQARPGLPVSGGLASGSGRPGGNMLILDDEVHPEGAVGVAIAGDVAVRTLVSQGCRPVGPSWVVTRADRNLVQELAGAHPVDRIRETFAEAAPEDQGLMRQGLHIGLAIDEYRHEHGRGDFLVRGVLGAQPESGAVAVGDVVRVGQTVRFHVRDAASADEDLRTLLTGFAAGGSPAAALLFTCNGRGARLFGRPHHDAELVQQVVGPVPAAGFFCAGELGPVGERSFLHGFTASVLAFDDPPGQM
jgi:small ligand-binding sensory domain FIST